MQIPRNILLNPGPATTTDTVKLAQVVPDICPRETEFGDIMRQLQKDVVKIVHGDPEKYVSVLFCGSGTICIDVCLNSLLPPGKKALIIDNGAYSNRAVEVCVAYQLPHIALKLPYDQPADLQAIEQALQSNPDVALVHIAHHETGMGLLNPIREIGNLVHRYGAIFTVDTIASYAMLPIDMEKDNIDFCMSSAQKGLMSMTGLSFIVGKEELIAQSKEYPTRSYYCNLYLQYDFFKRTGEMHFTPPVQVIYATQQAIKEYFEEGEENKYARHMRVNQALRDLVRSLDMKEAVQPEWQSGLVIAVEYPNWPGWSFEQVHDYCYERGYTIYPGKIASVNTFRLCSLGAIDVEDIEGFAKAFTEINQKLRKMETII